MVKNVNGTARLQWKVDTIKNCIHLQCIESFLWKKCEIWADLGLVGNSEKKLGPIMINFWGQFFYVFLGKKTFVLNIVACALKTCIIFQSFQFYTFLRNLTSYFFADCFLLMSPNLYGQTNFYITYIFIMKITSSNS